MHVLEQRPWLQSTDALGCRQLSQSGPQWSTSLSGQHGGFVPLQLWYVGLHATPHCPVLQVALALAGGMSQQKFPHGGWPGVQRTPQPAAPWHSAVPLVGGGRQMVPQVRQLLTSVAKLVQVVPQELLGA